MEAPLHVAASSLLRNLRTGYSATLYFLLTGFSARDINRLRRTLDGTGRTYTMKLLEAPDTAVFRGFRPLHGNLTPYYRLLLPDIVDEDRLLYFDSDTQINIDVSPLFELDMGSNAAGFVVDGIVSAMLESSFFLSLGKAPDGPAFNSGTMLFNILEWRRQDCLRRILAFCREHSEQLVTADQTALNAVFGGDCYRIDPRYNIKMYQVKGAEASSANGVLHFVGSPKPWDIGGRFLVKYAAQWFADLRKTAIPVYRQTPWLTAAAWARLPRILGGYRRLVKQKFHRR
jgi:lipopolysaccharide biosynthesis glycosyltransferase